MNRASGLARPQQIEAAYDLIAKVPVSGRTVLDHAAVLPREERGAYLVAAATHFAGLTADAHRYRLLPVDLRTFVESRKYLGRRGIVYPAVMDALVEMNDGTYVESVLTGGIGSGKTTAALLGMAWQHYLLSVLKDPHRDYGLDPASEILSVFQSLNARTARDNDYTRFRNMIAASPYFRERLPARRRARGRDGLSPPHRRALADRQRPRRHRRQRDERAAGRDQLHAHRRGLRAVGRWRRLRPGAGDVQRHRAAAEIALPEDTSACRA